MKRLFLTSSLASLALAGVCFAPSDETGAAVPPAPPEAPPAPPAAPVTVQRDRQNGFTRPIAGTKTGLVWDVADELSAKLGRPAKRDEVIEEYKKRVPDAMPGTMSTQYSRWCGFHNVAEVLKKLRADEKAAANAAGAEAKAKAEADKAAKAAEKDAEKAAKEKAKAEKAEAAAKAKEEKAAAAAKAKADKEAAAKAAKEAAAKAAAEAAAADVPPAPPAQ